MESLPPDYRHNVMLKKEGLVALTIDRRNSKCWSAISAAQALEKVQSGSAHAPPQAPAHVGPPAQSASHVNLRPEVHPHTNPDSQLPPHVVPHQVHPAAISHPQVNSATNLHAQVHPAANSQLARPDPMRIDNIIN